jgi:hypothetical protein
VLPEECYHEKPDFAEGSVESNQVVDLIFGLRIIHAREANWRINWENKKNGVTIRLGSRGRSGDTMKAEYNKMD